MSKVSILCVAATVLALVVPACDSGSSSQTGGGPLPAADAGDGNSYDSAAGAGGEGGAAGARATDFTTLCEQLSAAQCKQFYGCFSAADLAPNSSEFGTTEADCVTLFNTANCTGSACPSGKTFNPVSMHRCVANFAALSCSQFMAIADKTAANPGGCNSICE